MNWNQLLSTKRFGQEAYHAKKADDRSEFQRDYDRLIFSAPFRRLQNKTQVFPLPGSVFVHNRLTHSLEVACVGRSLGVNVAHRIHKDNAVVSPFLDEIGSIISAACLAHDLGNPPFGHSGERAIATFFSEGNMQNLKSEMTAEEWKDCTCFEGNANAFRLLTHQFIGRRPGGFVLTYSTLASIVKYPYSSIFSDPKKQKFGFFDSEKADFNKIAAELGIPRLPGNPDRYARHPLVYLVEAADDICYALIDLEDGLEMELLEYAEVESLLLNLVGDDLPETFRQLGPLDSRRRKLAILRGKAIEHLTNAAARAFVEQQDALLAGTLPGDLVEHMHGPAKRCVLNAKDMARKKIFQDKRKTLHEIGAYTTLEILLNAFCGAALEQHNGRTPSFKSRRILDLLGNNAPDPRGPLHTSFLRMIDFIAGMTDSYASEIALEMTGRSSR